MEKIRIKELIDFRNRSEKSRKTFAHKLKNRKPKEKSENDTEGGGDYWVTSTSCIYNVGKSGNKDLYGEKIDELHSKYENSEDKRIKTMYQRNIEILTSFIDFDLEDLKPKVECKFESIPKQLKVIQVDNFPIFVNPNLIFSFENKGKNEIGAIWLVPKLNGFNKTELGMFCEMLYRFLVKNYGSEYQISEEYCLVIDTFNAQKIDYFDLLKGNVPFLIDKTLKELKEL
ncbi:hypothetical protein ACNFNZ_05090 [Empedobacter brevis]